MASPGRGLMFRPRQFERDENFELYGPNIADAWTLEPHQFVTDKYGHLSHVTRGTFVMTTTSRCCPQRTDVQSRVAGGVALKTNGCKYASASQFSTESSGKVLVEDATEHFQNEEPMGWVSE